MWGTSFKKSPTPPKNFNGRERKGSPLQLPLTLYGEGCALFRGDFACGEIGCRKRRGPSPIRSTM